MTVVLLHGGRPAGQGAENRRGPAAGASSGRRAAAGRASGAAEGQRFAAGIGMLEAARAGGFVLLVPQAVAGNWNDGRPEVARDIDDVGFLRALLSDAGGRTAIAPERTFVTGVSNGGLMSYRMACEASDAVRAIAPVVANMGRALSARCPAGRAVDILQIMGGADPLMPIGGGGIGGRAADARGGVMSAAETLRFWTARMPGAPATAVAEADGVTRTSLTAGPVRYRQVVLADYGHGWPGVDAPRGGANPAREALLGRIRGKNPTGFDATREIVRFFQEVRLRG